MGARLTHDDISASAYVEKQPGIINTGAIKPADADKMTATALTYRIGPQYFFTPDLQVFASFSRGYKGPIVDTTTADFGRVLPETVNAWEAGVRSSWLERRVTANLVLFHERFKNYQTSTLNSNVTPNVFQLGNAGGQLSQGVEFELSGKPTPNLTLSSGLTVLDSHYTQFTTACYTTPANFAASTQAFKQPQTTVGPLPGYCYSFTSGASTVRTMEAAGFPLMNASKYTYRIGLTYEREIAKGLLFDANANYLWRSSFYSAPDPNLINRDYGIANFNIGLSPTNGKWRAGLFVRNAANQFFTVAIQNNTSDGGAGGSTNVLPTESVRTVGLSLDFKLGH